MPPRYVDDCRILESYALARAGFLKPGRRAWEWALPGRPRTSAEIVAEPGKVILRYRLDATGEEMEQHVALDVVPCKPTRGARLMWLCPTCGRRCSKLYGSGDRRFACIECLGLRHKSQSEREHRRMLRRASQMRVLLIGTPVDGEIPPPYRSRHRDPRRALFRARMREALAKMAFELLRSDKNP
jgi:hypothetical protein